MRTGILLVVGVLIGWALGAAFSDYYLPISTPRVNAYKWQIGIKDGHGAFTSSLPRGSYRWQLKDENGKSVDAESAGLEVKVFIGDEPPIASDLIQIEDGRFTRVHIEISPGIVTLPDQLRAEQLMFRAVF